MKFCPNCGAKLEDKDKCICGYIVSENRVEENTEVPKYFTETVYPFNNSNNDIEKIMKEMKEKEIPLDKLKENKIDLGKIISISYTNSGGMMGAFHNTSLSFEDKKLTVTNKDWHHAPKIEKVYITDESVLDKISKLIIDNNLASWNDIPVNNYFIAYDAPTSNMYITFEKKSISISGIAMLTDEENEIYRNIRDLVFSFADDKNLISENTLEEGEEINPMNGFIGMGMVNNTNNTDNTKYKTFCPECGNGIVEGQDNCSCCGYTIKKGN